MFQLVKNNIQSGLLLLVALWMFSCTEEIDLKLKSAERRLVVEAVITNEPQTQYVKLTYSGDYFSNAPMQEVNEARVFLKFNDQSVEFIEHPANNGVYYSPNGFKVIEGINYQLVINGVDANNDSYPEQYTAESYMPLPVKLDAIGLGYQPLYKFWQILFMMKDPEELKNYYMFRYFKNDSLVTDVFSEYGLGDDRFFNGRMVNDAVFWLDSREPAENLLMNDVVKLEMYGIDERFYNYLSAIKEETRSRVPLFSGAPANVPGNISGGALGIFAMCSVSNAIVEVKHPPEYYVQ